jgi:hypothetical protein
MGDSEKEIIVRVTIRTKKKMTKVLKRSPLCDYGWSRQFLHYLATFGAVVTTFRTVVTMFRTVVTTFATVSWLFVRGAVVWLFRRQLCDCSYTYLTTFATLLCPFLHLFDDIWDG